jgi:hypothetical protein
MFFWPVFIWLPSYYTRQLYVFMKKSKINCSLRIKCSSITIVTEYVSCLYVCIHNVTCLTCSVEVRDSNLDRDKLSQLLLLCLKSNFEEMLKRKLNCATKTCKKVISIFYTSLNSEVPKYSYTHTAITRRQGDKQRVKYLCQVGFCAYCYCGSMLVGPVPRHKLEGLITKRKDTPFKVLEAMITEQNII